MASDLRPHFLDSSDEVPTENRRIMAEWDAWRQVSRQIMALKPVGDDTTYKPLLLAVRMWGEELHALRLNAEHRRKLELARIDYAPHHLADPPPPNTKDKS